MATDDYLNPTSIRPEYGFKPEGFLGGMHYARDRARYEDVASLQDYMMRNSAQKSGMELQDYTANAPVRDAERLANIEKAKATSATIGGIKQNELTKGNLENELSAKTMAAAIAEKITAAKGKERDEGMASLAAGAAIGRALGAAAGNGPLALDAVLKQLEQSKADPRIVQWFRNSRDIPDLMKKAGMITDAFMQANEHYRSTMDANKATNESRERAARTSAGATIEAARIRQKDKVKSIDQMLQEAAKWAPDRRKSFYEQVLIDSDATPQQQDKARTGIEEAVKALNFNAPKDAPPILGPDGRVLMPGDQPRRYGEGPGGGGKEDKFVVGKKYTDANGNTATYQGNGKWSQ